MKRLLCYKQQFIQNTEDHYELVFTAKNRFCVSLHLNFNKLVAVTNPLPFFNPQLIPFSLEQTFKLFSLRQKRCKPAAVGDSIRRDKWWWALTLTLGFFAICLKGSFYGVTYVVIILTLLGLLLTLNLQNNIKNTAAKVKGFCCLLILAVVNSLSEGNMLQFFSALLKDIGPYITISAPSNQNLSRKQVYQIYIYFLRNLAASQQIIYHPRY